MSLSVPMFHILLALGQDRLHGYGIMQAIDRKTSGAARVLPGTLYTTLNRMIDRGFIVEAAGPVEGEDDERRRAYYQVTAAGHRAVAEEANRINMLLSVAKANRQIP